MSGQRQPINLIVHKGNKHLTKQEIEDRKSKEIIAPSDNIQPPSYLNTKTLKNKFNEIANELVNIGIMSNLDCDALARFILAQTMYEKLTKQLLKMKPMVMEENILKANPDYTILLNNQDKLFKQCKQAATDLGLTISSRCRLVIPNAPTDDKPISKWDKYRD